MHLRLVSVAMTEDELATIRRRRGYWLKLARLRANLDQNSVAAELGLTGTKSGTSVMAWEKGRRSPKMEQLEKLARLYGVPLSTFTEPRPTDEEWLDELATGAGVLEREDREAGEGAGPTAGGGSASEPRTQIA